jgi:DNA polymerase-1
MLTPARLVTMLGVRPEQYRDYAALRGDASDNLPGVRGVGPKTAAILLAALGSARAVFDDVARGGARVAEAIGAARARQLADPQARAAWELNCQVMAMHADVPLGIDLSGGIGCLPLPADAVRTVFLAQELTWTTAAALRVLAGQESAGSPAPPADAGWSPGAEAGWSPDAKPEWSPRPEPSWSTGRRRYGRLPRTPEPRTEQLALF